MQHETSVYKTVDGHDILADVYRPAKGRGAAPAVLWLHGGALIFGSRRNIDRRQLDAYLDAGLTVVAADYRLAPETKLPHIIEDVTEAYGWLRREGPRLGVDPERVAVVGHSAGGYLSLMAGCVFSPPPAAVVSFYGYGDIVADWYTRPDPFYCRMPAVSEAQARSVVGRETVSEAAGLERFPFYLYCRQNGLWPLEVGGRDPAADPSFFEPYCPLRRAGPSFPPALLLHGDEDTDVPFEQSLLMARALERAGVEARLLRLAGGAHGFDHDLDDAAAAAAFAEVLAFLGRRLAAAAL